MKKRRITLDVNCTQAFDMLSAMQGNTGPLGTRLAGLLMTGEVGFADAVGLATYGITVTAVEEIAEVAP